ncbi:MAG: N-formylglutamate amidohydrolase [Deltaproteobacteria bacterium]|nr:N-formylglutamate amidohydrolase [Deltaproteobacteria bacterium]
MAGLILNVPYGSPFLPKAVHKRLTHTEEELRWENYRLTDPFLLEIVKKAAQPDPAAGPLSEALVKPELNAPHRLPNARLVSYPYSPLVADPLGLLAKDLGQLDKPEPCLLTKGALEKNLPNWSSAEREFIFSHCVKPYVDQLVAAGKELLAQERLAILVNVRFFSHKTYLHDHRELPKPQINLGLEEKLTPKGLATLVGHVFRQLGLWAELDFPLVGSCVPPEMAAWPRLKALGLAIRRDLYLDEAKARLKPSEGSLVRVLRTFFSLLGQELDRVSDVRLRRAFPPKAPSNVIKASQMAQAG